MNAPVSLGPAPGVRARPFRSPTPQNAGVLVTGAGQRLGRAIAQDLAASGWPVAIHYQASDGPARALRDQIRRDGGTAETVQADLSLEPQAAQLVSRATQRVGPIGVLINNASVFEWDELRSFDAQSWSRHMDLNLRAPLLLCQSFADQVPHDQGGVIVNMLDSRVLNPTPRYLTYTLSKTGLWTVTRTLAQALAPQVRVNGIGPGPTLPQRGQTGEEFERRCERLPLQRAASPDEICHAVRFLISVESMTGQVIALDGGDHLVGYHYAA